MFPIEQTSIENKQGNFALLRDFFEEHGYVVGGNWDYHQGYFDKQIGNEQGYLFVRIPVFAEDGDFGEETAQLRIGTPFLLHHQYNPGMDKEATSGNVTATLNQFQAPVDPDGDLTEQEIELAKQEIEALEQAFLERFPQ